MARGLCGVIDGGIYHVLNRGNGRMARVAKKHGLESTLRDPWRPRKAQQTKQSE